MNKQEAQKSIRDREDFLQHYGVLGMKWGVRKDKKAGKKKSDGKLSRSDKKKIRAKKKEIINDTIISEKKANKYADKKIKTKIEDVEKAFDDFLAEKKPEKHYIDTEKKHVDEKANLFNEYFNDHPEDLPKGVTLKYSGSDNYSGNSLKPFAEYYYNGEKIRVDFGSPDYKVLLEEPKSINHSYLDFKTEHTLDQFKGEAFDILGREDFLEHYGVLGMKWGVRTDPVTGREMPTKEYKKLKKQRAKEEKQQGKRGSEDYKEVQQIKKKKLEDMSNDEVQKLVRRMQLEKQYKDSSEHPGKKLVNDILKETAKDQSKKYINKAANAGLDRAFEEVMKVAMKG